MPWCLAPIRDVPPAHAGPWDLLRQRETPLQPAAMCMSQIQAEPLSRTSL